MEFRKFVSDHSRDIFILSIISLLIIGMFLPYHKFSTLFFDGEKKIQVENERVHVAILDQFHDERPSFTRKTVELFEREDIEVDVYENITIDLYRQLPTLGYKVVILRVHSSTRGRTEKRTQYVSGLFTTEKYEPSKHPVLQTKGLVVPGAPRGVAEEKNIKFCITPKFVKNEMNGKFDNTLLVVDSCTIFNLESNYKLAGALYGKGASAIVSWNAQISLRVGDTGTLLFLKHILLNDMTIVNAVRTTNEEIAAGRAKVKVMALENGRT